MSRRRGKLNMNGFEDGDRPKPTRAMGTRPDNREGTVYAESLTGDEDLTLCPVFSDDAFKRIVNYPVIVEGWDKKKSGRVKREWLKQFTEAERNLVARYYGKFYRWYLVTGTPRRVIFRKMKTIHTLQRAAAFFATI